MKFKWTQGKIFLALVWWIGCVPSSPITPVDPVPLSPTVVAPDDLSIPKSNISVSQTRQSVGKRIRVRASKVQSRVNVKMGPGEYHLEYFENVGDEIGYVTSSRPGVVVLSSTDHDGNSVTTFVEFVDQLAVTVRNPYPVVTNSEWGPSVVLVIPGQKIEFDVVGGIPPYEWKWVDTETRVSAELESTEWAAPRKEGRYSIEVSDQNNHLATLELRVVRAPGKPDLFFGDGGVVSMNLYRDPKSIALDGDEKIYVVDDHCQFYGFSQDGEPKTSGRFVGRDDRTSCSSRELIYHQKNLYFVFEDEEGAAIVLLDLEGQRLASASLALRLRAEPEKNHVLVGDEGLAVVGINSNGKLEIQGFTHQDEKLVQSFRSELSTYFENTEPLALGLSSKGGYRIFGVEPQKHCLRLIEYRSNGTLDDELGVCDLDAQYSGTYASLALGQEGHLLAGVDRNKIPFMATFGYPRGKVGAFRRFPSLEATDPVALASVNRFGTTAAILGQPRMAELPATATQGRTSFSPLRLLNISFHQSDKIYWERVFEQNVDDVQIPSAWGYFHESWHARAGAGSVLVFQPRAKRIIVGIPRGLLGLILH